MAIHLCLLAVQLIFAAFPVFAKIAFREISPFALAFVRMASSSILLLVWFYGFSRERIETADYAGFALFSFFGILVNQLFYLKGLEMTTAINATILIGAIPVFTFISALILRREAATRLRVIGIVLAFLGVFVLVGPSGIRLSDAHAFGNMLLFISALAYSLYLVLSRDLMARYHPMTVVTWVFALGTIEIFPFCWNDVTKTVFASLSTITWISIGFLILFGSIVTYVLNGVALKSVPASVVAVYICTQPVFGALMAVPILGEQVTVRMAGATLLIVAGVYVSAILPHPSLEGLS